MVSDPAQRVVVGRTPVFLGSDSGCDLVVPGVPPLAVDFTASEGGVTARRVGADGGEVGTFTCDGRMGVLGGVEVHCTGDEPFVVMTSPPFATTSRNRAVVQEMIALERATLGGGDVLLLARPHLETLFAMSRLAASANGRIEMPIEEPWETFDEWIKFVDGNVDLVLYHADWLSLAQQERLADALLSRSVPSRSRIILVCYGDVIGNANRGRFSMRLFHALRRNLVRLVPYGEKPDEVAWMLEEGAATFGIKDFRKRVSESDWNSVCTQAWPNDHASLGLVMLIVVASDDGGPIDLSRAYATHLDLLYGTNDRPPERVERARWTLRRLYDLAGCSVERLSQTLPLPDRALRRALTDCGVILSAERAEPAEDVTSRS